MLYGKDNQEEKKTIWNQFLALQVRMLTCLNIS